MGLKAIIVGGSVSGLSLAIMLEELGVDYVLLEAHEQFAPQLGASIGLLPNGLRILDQLGCYEAIRKRAGNFYNYTNLRDSSGRALAAPKTVSVAARLEERTGYPLIFFDRQHILQILHDRVKHKERLLTGKRVTTVEMHGEGVKVHTKDGSVYTGDFLVGADGVHSMVRKEMWRLGNEMSPGVFSPNEGSKLKSSTKCMFGISSRPPTFAYQSQDITFQTGYSYMTMSAPDDRMYWFMFVTMPTTYGKDIPRYTKEDEAEFAKQFFDDKITETVKFGDLYKNRHVTALVSLEEHVFEKWHFQRIITIGDAAQKLHPITASGGNNAIEAAASLANGLSRRIKAAGSTNLSQEALESAFAEVHAHCYDRSLSQMKQGEAVQYYSTLQGPLAGFILRYVVPLFGDYFSLKTFQEISAGGTHIEGMALPERLPLDGKRAAKTGGFGWALWSLGAVGSGIVAMVCLGQGNADWRGRLVGFASQMKLY